MEGEIYLYHLKVLLRIQWIFVILLSLFIIKIIGVHAHLLKS